MKKVLNNRVFLFFITAIVFTTVGVAAESVLRASDIAYKDSNVEAALNDLYEKSTGSTINYETWVSAPSVNNAAGYQTKVRVYFSVTTSYDLGDARVTGSIVNNYDIADIDNAYAFVSGRYVYKFFDITVNTNGQAGDINVEYYISGPGTNSADAIIMYE